MDDPIAEIEGVVRQLTQGSPCEQEQAIERYLTTDFAFTHPFCSVVSFQGSRKVYQSILRWYKIMSPKIELHIKSTGEKHAPPSRNMGYSRWLPGITPAQRCASTNWATALRESFLLLVDNWLTDPVSKQPSTNPTSSSTSTSTRSSPSGSFPSTARPSP
jgi:hypothetical protein